MSSLQQMQRVILEAERRGAWQREVASALRRCDRLTEDVAEHLAGVEYADPAERARRIEEALRDAVDLAILIAQLRAGLRTRAA